MTTKEKILHEALRLFSQRGYAAVGVEQIAAAVGIKAASLYKHYKNKQAIFDAIFEETAKRYDSFTNAISVHTTDAAHELETFRTITADELVKKVRGLVQYSLHDEYVCYFRKMMTIEQFRSPEFSELYSRRYVNMMFEYHKRLFTKMIAAGVMKDENPASLAMMYGAPIYVQIGICDRHPEMEEQCLQALEGHVRLFFKTFSLVSEDKGSD